MCDDLLEAWRTNYCISLHLIDRISDAGMQCALSKRAVASPFSLPSRRAERRWTGRQATRFGAGIRCEGSRH